MIITCKECSTSFNLDDSLVKKGGSKCRCSVCQHIFTAYPLSMEKDQEHEESPTSILESELPDSKIDEDELEFESSEFEISGSDADKKDSDFDIDDDFSFEDSEFEVDDNDTSQETREEDTLGFEYDDFEFAADSEAEDSDDIEFESVEDDAPAPETEEDEPVIEMEDEVDEDLDDASITEDDKFELEFDVEDDSDIEEKDSGGIEDDVEDEDDTVISYEKESIGDGDHKESSAVIPEDEFAEYDEVLEQETEPENNDSHEEEITKVPHEEMEPMLTPAPGSRRKKKKSGIGTPVLLLLLIFLLVAGAYIVSIMTGYKIPYISNIQIPFIEQYLKKPVREIINAEPMPDQKSVNGRFVTNSITGTLFVITGKIENPSNIAYKHIKIRGALITKGKQEAKIKTAYCGNIIPEDMLENGNIADINKIMAVKTGNNNLNTNIKPKTSIHFMIVFSDLPDNLQNFTVKVISFEKVKAN